jgi:hypothetical protein
MLEELSKGRGALMPLAAAQKDSAFRQASSGVSGCGNMRRLMLWFSTV